MGFGVAVFEHRTQSSLDYIHGFLCIGKNAAAIMAMTNLLEKALDAVKRLPEDRQNIVAEAMLALAENETQGLFDVEPTDEEPDEEQILALMPTVMPSALPSKPKWRHGTGFRARSSCSVTGWRFTIPIAIVSPI
jgi:hypothetical protein